MDELWGQREALTAQGTICPYVFHRNGKRITTFREPGNGLRGGGVLGACCKTCGARPYGTWNGGGLSRSVAMQLTGNKTEAI